MDAAAIAAAVRAGRTRAVDVAEASLRDIAARDPGINSFTLVARGRALGEAASVDADVAAGRDPGPLAGVPVAVKNLFDIAGITTIAGSRILRDAPPAAADAFALRRLRAAGAVLVGALNMDEFAYGFSTENEHYGPTRNPRDPARIAGGSSGGSAAAVAAGMVPIALGTDTNGSVRVPAALCGVFGLKPTYGRLSRKGVFPFVASLDHVGAFARSVADLALAYDALQGIDPDDPAQAPQPPETVSQTLDAAPPQLRTAVLDGWFRARAERGALAAVDRVASALDATARATLAGADRARAGAFCITAAEGGALHLANLRARPEEFDVAVRARLLAGALLPATVVVEAQRFRRRFAAAAAALFDRFDLLLAPATPCAATPIGQPTIEIDGETMPVRANLGIYTQPISFIGLPVVTVPVPTPGGLPYGVQLIGAPWAEATVLRAARRLEQAGVVAAPVAA